MKRKLKSGPHEMNGKMGDMVYYHLNGRYVSRRIGKIDKKRFREEAVFEDMRRQQSEFGLASQYGKVIRAGLGPYYRLFSGPECSGRLTGALCRCLKEGEGKKGERIFSKSSLAGLAGFALNARKRGVFEWGSRWEFDRKHSRLYLGGKRGSWYDPVLTGAQVEELVVGVVLLSPLIFKEGYDLLLREWHGRSFFYAIDPDDVEGQDLLLEPEEKEVLPEGLLAVGVMGFTYARGEAGRGWIVGSL
ncbi:MAG TPA: hypothetical protein DCG19_10570 [Cryomorphaceae bacterium]|nr:hypothetical protein [Owenweeksia sp.]HAD97840.1 hypothetical protein [Cryomorphaceae bacterium]